MRRPEHLIVNHDGTYVGVLREMYGNDIPRLLQNIPHAFFGFEFCEEVFDRRHSRIDESNGKEC